MAIPGLKANFEVRAKVRIGLKKKTADGKKEFPSSVDYFICDDPEFAALGDQPREVLVRLPFAAASDNFTTGLEFWRGKQLTCYSKGEPEASPIAYRVESMVKPGDTLRGEKMGRGAERQPITCTFRECAFFKSKDCRPMGRLQFFLDGGRTDSVLQIDTKSWNTIEGVEATLGAAAAKGDLRGRVFKLSVRMEQKGNQRFPVVSLTEEGIDVKVNSEADVAKADALVALAGSLERGDADELLKAFLVTALNHTNPGWREVDGFIDRIKKVGPKKAAVGLLERNL